MAAESGVDVGKGFAATLKAGFPQNVPLLIAFAAQAVGIVATIKNAVSAAKSKEASVGGGGGGGAGGGAPAAAAPSFNIVGDSTENQLANALGENDQKPIKAFVTSGDVTNAQALDRNIIENASI